MIRWVAEARTAVVLLAAVALGAMRVASVEAVCTITCNGNPCTITATTYNIDPNCVLTFAGKNVTIPNGAVLQNTAGDPFAIRAGSLTLNGTLRSPGGSIAVDVDGALTMAPAGSLIDTSSAAADEWGTVDITARGAVTLRNVKTDGVSYGGDLYVDATSINVIGVVTADGASTPGGTAGGYVWLTTTGNLTVSGSISAVATGAQVGDGGTIDLRVDGDVSVAASATLRANGGNGGSGGDVLVIADGAATIDGDLLADTDGADAWGGSVSVVGATGLTVRGDWSAAGGNGVAAGGGFLDAQVDRGSVTLTSTAALKANAAGGGQGGDVDIGAFAIPAMGIAGNVTIDGTVDVGAAGSGSSGGRIAVTSVGGNVVVTGTLDARSTAATGRDGRIEVAACNVSVSGTLRNDRHADGGGNVLHYTDALTVTGTGRVLAGANAGNTIECSCRAMVGAAMCATPDTCATLPTLQAGSTVIPAPVLQPKVRIPCSCGNGVRDGLESGVDCGGATFCPRCANFKPCGADTDCVDKACDTGICQPHKCPDGRQNGNETDKDCGGGPPCMGCNTGQRCRVPSDCLAGVCPADGRCAPPKCDDGIKNGAETATDCGGSSVCFSRYPGNSPFIRLLRFLCYFNACDGCGPGQPCGGNGDCASSKCIDGRCL